MPKNFLSEATDKPLAADVRKEGAETFTAGKATKLLDLTITKRKSETADGVIEEIFFRCKVYAMNEKILVFLFGVVFIVVMLFIAHSTPEPTSFQYFVFRTVLSAAVAGIAVFIPGLLDINLGKWLKASGALAIFVLVYYVNPASLAEVFEAPTTEATASE